jgi:hypothetical protein
MRIIYIFHLEGKFSIPRAEVFYVTIHAAVQITRQVSVTLQSVYTQLCKTCHFLTSAVQNINRLYLCDNLLKDSFTDDVRVDISKLSFEEVDIVKRPMLKE